MENHIATATLAYHFLNFKIFSLSQQQQWQIAHVVIFLMENILQLVNRTERGEKSHKVIIKRDTPSCTQSHKNG